MTSSLLQKLRRGHNTAQPKSGNGKAGTVELVSPKVQSPNSNKKGSEVGGELLLKKKRNKIKSKLLSLIAYKEKEEPEWILPFQETVKNFYDHHTTQVVVAVLIFLNFIFSALDAQVLPQDGDDKPTKLAFTIIEMFFTIAFTIELLINMYGSFFSFFWRGPVGYWNGFDFCIVSVSLLSIGLSEVPGLGVLRLLRAFRVFRLFSRVKSLRLIVEGVLASIPGVTNAFAILFIFMGIWSIIGVEYFAEKSPEFFGTFLKGMFTMFQILTGDSWNAQVTRELVFNQNMPIAGIFSISFVFIAAIVLSNVVVAILLDKFLSAVEKQNKADEIERLAEEKRKEARDKERVALGITEEEEKQRHRLSISEARGFISSHLSVVNPFPPYLPRQDVAKRLYESNFVQISIGLLIMVNFIVGALNAQILPKNGTSTYYVFESLDLFFTSAFTIELILNMYGGYPTEFWTGPASGWNMFDFIIVTVSLVAIAFPSLPGVSVFRLFRAFRVVRLFKRVESLKLIIESVLMCLSKVLQAFLILLIITGVWATMGVEFFRFASKNEFGSFIKAFLTMWQVLTADSWASGDNMARYLIYRENMPMAAIFFISYIFLNTIIMSNVVITILLEGYLKCSEELKQQIEIEEQGGHATTSPDATTVEDLESQRMKDMSDYALQNGGDNELTDMDKSFLANVFADKKFVSSLNPEAVEKIAEALSPDARDRFETILVNELSGGKVMSVLLQKLKR